MSSVNLSDPNRLTISGPNGIEILLAKRAIIGIWRHVHIPYRSRLGAYDERAEPVRQQTVVMMEGGEKFMLDCDVRAVLAWYAIP